MCHQLGITRSAFYKWKHRIVPEQEQLNSEIAELIKEYDERFSHILGYRRMTDWINHFNHTNYSRKRIHRIMKILDIHAIIRKKKKKYKKTLDKPCKIGYNHFAVSAAGHIWRHSSVGRAFGSYPECHWFESNCRYQNGPLVKWLRHRPFTAVTWVRVPYGSPENNLCPEDKGFFSVYGTF